MSNDVLIGEALTDLVDSVWLSEARHDQAIAEFRNLRRRRVHRYAVSAVASAVVIVAVAIGALLIATSHRAGGQQQTVRIAKLPKPNAQPRLQITLSQVPKGFSVGAETSQRVPISNHNQGVEYSLRLTSGGSVILVDAMGAPAAQPVRRRDYLHAYPDAKFIQVGGQKVLDLTTNVSTDYQWTDANHNHVDVMLVRGGTVADCLQIINHLSIVDASS